MLKCVREFISNVQCQVPDADQWFGINGMVTNPEKYQAMILGNTNYSFSFTVNDTGR